MENFGSNLQDVSDEWLKVALEITGDFETDGDPWSMITGNFDSQGISCGVLQQNIGKGSLQPLVIAGGLELVKKYMPVYGDEFWRACRASIAEGLRVVNSWQFKQGGEYKVKAPILQELRAFFGSPGMIRQQLDAAKEVGNQALKAATAWAAGLRGKDPSLREFCWFFDIYTQNGGMKGIRLEDVKEFIAKHSAEKAAAVVCEEISKFPVHPGYQKHRADALKNIALWEKEMRAEYLHLFVLSYLRTLKSIPEYWYVVVNRKGTIALTRGYVNGSHEDFAKLRGGQLVLSETGEDGRSGVVEISGAVVNLEVWNAGEIHQCKVTLETGEAVYTTSAQTQALLETAYARREPITLIVEDGTEREIIRASLGRAASGAARRTLFRIPAGTEGVGFEGDDADDVRRWGPAGFSIAPDYTFIVTDSVGGRLLRYNFSGGLIQIIEVAEALGIADAAMKVDGSFVVLDTASPKPVVLQLAYDSATASKTAMPEELLARGLSGLRLSDTGDVLLELFGGAEYFDVNARARVPGKNLNIKYEPEAAAEQQGPGVGSRCLVEVDGDTRLEISVVNLLGDVSLLHRTRAGDLFVLTEEVTSDPVIDVDQVIHRYSPDGVLLGQARVPLSTYTFVQHNVAVGPDDQVFAMFTNPEGAEIVRLDFAPLLEPILAPTISPEADDEGLRPLDISLTGITRDQIIKNAEEYVNLELELSSGNIDGSCPGRNKPRYLGAPGVYKSVSYDWGGGDTVEGFKRFMTAGLQAGDIVPPKSVESCSKGVDCSGFVTRCWGIPYPEKYGTATLPDISNRISLSELLPGDVLNMVGSHVVVFDKFERSGGAPVRVLTYEATQGNKFDRVVHTWWPWSRLKGYTPRRYKRLTG